MQYAVIQRILGLLLILFSTTMVPPIIVSFIFKDGSASTFAQALAVILSLGMICWFPVRKVRKELRMRDGFLVVVLFWTVLGCAGALPLYLSDALDLNIASSLFESLSGLTTTGATVIVNIDLLPKSILFYRQELQWLGGMGIIVLAVAILPLLGIGGMQLYRAETPGPDKENKLTPRITETAKALWYIYLLLTIACALAYWFAGMSVFDAIAHSFSTIAIGGFSTHDASMGYFNSTAIDMVAVVFMLLAGINFGLHYVSIRSRSLSPYPKDAEFITYIGILASVALVTILYLIVSQTFDTSEALLQGLFQVVSIGTTTGFTTTNYLSWPGFLPVLLLFTSFVGGCAGSTGGGMKVIRIMLLFKQGMRELKRLVHPNAQLIVKMGSTAVPDRVIDAVWGFFATYVAVFSVMMLLLLASGLDQVTAFSAVAATINNLGPGLGEVGANYASINDFSKLVLCFSMLLGRLEIFTLIVLFTPAFWAK